MNIPYTFNNAKITYRNFKGEETTHSQHGTRFFHIKLDESLARRLKDDWWNVRFDNGVWVLPINVRFTSEPVNIILIKDSREIKLIEDNVSILDSVNIIKADIDVNGFVWKINDRCGVKAYLKSLRVAVTDDVFINYRPEICTLDTLNNPRA